MRIYSYLFHLLLALFLTGISVVALASGTDLHMAMLPWSKNVATWLLVAALFGLISVLLAIKGVARVLFFVWSLAVVLLLLKGFFLSSYTFGSRSSFNSALYLTLAAILACLGAWYSMRRQALRR